MKKKMIIAAFLLLLGGNAISQTTYNSSGRSGTSRTDAEKGFDPDRLIIGGGIGLSFGTVTAIGASPVIGYRITDKFAAGVGLGYLYVRVKNQFRVYNASSGEYDFYPSKASLYYPSIWARHTLFGNIFGQAEFEYDMQRYRVHAYDDNPASPTFTQHISYVEKYNSPAALVGLGLRQPVSDRVSFLLMAMYDVIQHEYSPYRNRVDIRVGVNVGW
jgi:long-subunit fatty acid transport protein